MHGSPDRVNFAAVRKSAAHRGDTTGMNAILDHLSAWGQPLMSLQTSEFITLSLLALAWSMWLVYDAGT